MASIRASARERARWGPDSRHDLIADPEDRVQARQRILKNHGNLGTSPLAQLFGRKLQQVDA
jgi:hypothetical protein